jgi:hypothetical protein
MEQHDVFLADVAPEKEFVLLNGHRIRNIHELVSELKALDDYAFSHHCNYSKDDFATWIGDALNEPSLASSLQIIKSKELYIDRINGAITRHESNSHSKITKSVEHIIPVEPKIEEATIGKTDVSFEHKKIDSTNNNLSEDKHLKNNSKNHLVEKRISNEKEDKKTLPEKIEVATPLNKKDHEHLKKYVSKAIDEIEDALSKERSRVKLELDKINTTTKKLEDKFESTLKSKGVEVEAAIEEHVSRAIASRLNDKDFKSSISRIIESNAQGSVSEIVGKERSKLQVESGKISEAKTHLGKFIEESISDIRKRNDKAIREAVIQTVSRQILDKDFRKNITKTVDDHFEGIMAKERAKFKAELEHISTLNEALDKRLETSLKEKDKQINKILESSVKTALAKQLDDLNDRIAQDIEAKASKALQSLDKKANISTERVFENFKENVAKEKAGLKETALLEIQKELGRILADDKELEKIIAKHRDFLAIEHEKILTKQKTLIHAFESELERKKDSAIHDGELNLQKQLSSILTSQRNLLDGELAKTLSSNKHFVERFEKDIRDLEKGLMETVNRRLEEGYTKHNNLISTASAKHLQALAEEKKDMELTVKEIDEKIDTFLNSKVHEAINKEFNQVLSKQKSMLDSEMSRIVTASKDAAIVKINTEFNSLLSNQKNVITKEFDVAVKRQNDLTSTFIKDLTKVQEGMVHTAELTLQKQLRETIQLQRDILDTELAKTLRSNNYFIDRFEKDITLQRKNFIAEADLVLTEGYKKHELMLQSTANSVLNTLAEQKLAIDNSIKFKEAEINNTINLKVREAMNKEFSEAILNERKLLDTELTKASEFNQSLEKRFETEIKAREAQLIDMVYSDAKKKFDDALSKQQESLNAELDQAKTMNDNFNKQKSEMMTKSQKLLSDLEKVSKTKLDQLESKNAKHIEKISAASNIVKRADESLAILKEIKDYRSVMQEDKKRFAIDTKKRSDTIAEIDNLKKDLEDQKSELESLKTKLSIYDLIHRCNTYIKLKDMQTVKSLYDKITILFNNAELDKFEKDELYKAVMMLYTDIQITFNRKEENN